MFLTGTLKMKKNEEVVSDKFKKREFVLTDNSSQYPQHISFQLTQAKCDLIDNYQIGTEIKVHFNLRGREWASPSGEIKYFNTLEAWKIENEAGASMPVPSSTNFEEAPFPSGGDDLPF
jgi:hypothetical protein